MTEQDDADFLKRNLRSDSSQLAQAISLLIVTLHDPETRVGTVAAGIMTSFCQALTPTTEQLEKYIFRIESLSRIDVLRDE